MERRRELVINVTNTSTKHTNLDRQDTSNNGDINPGPLTIMIELDESFSLKEELCDDEISSCVNFLFQMLDVLFVIGTVRMTVGIAWIGGGMCIGELCSPDSDQKQNSMYYVHVHV